MAALGMYKNQLQELAQRSCFNLPSYSCVREGPDHAPRFKAIVNFNGELFESPNYCTTLKQAEHAAAEAALVALSQRGGPSQYLAAKILVMEELLWLKSSIRAISLDSTASTSCKLSFNHVHKEQLGQNKVKLRFAIRCEMIDKMVEYPTSCSWWHGVQF